MSGPYSRIILFSLATIVSAQNTALRFRGEEIAIIRPSAGQDCEAITHTPAKLCLQSSARCYTPPRWEPPFGYRAKAVVIRLSEELDAILFTVESTSCGSGSLQFVGLLDLRESALVNVLPDVIISNQGEYSLWSDESVSPVALFATADAIMANGETHFAPHYSRVTAYTFDAKRRAYSKRLQYITKSRYVSLDHEERITVLEPEKNEILSRLKRLADR